MGWTLETAAVQTKSSLPLLTRYRPLRFTSPVQPGRPDGPHFAPTPAAETASRVARPATMVAVAITLLGAGVPTVSSPDPYWNRSAVRSAPGWIVLAVVATRTAGWSPAAAP